MQQQPERIVIDTSQPTIVPPPMRFEEAAPDEPPPPVPSHASAAPSLTVTGVDKERSKAIKRRGNELAAKQAPLPRTPAMVSAAPVTTLPSTRLSFANILSGQIVRDLFSLR
jgi:hypothetical protein